MILQKDIFTEFLFFRPKAKNVCLAGDFNGWRLSPMTPQGDGYWVARVALPAGTFKFRYNADGQWFADYAAFGVEYGPFGIDSVVRVEAQRPHVIPMPQPAKRQGKARKTTPAKTAIPA